MFFLCKFNFTVTASDVYVTNATCPLLSLATFDQKRFHITSKASYKANLPSNQEPLFWDQKHCPQSYHKESACRHFFLEMGKLLSVRTLVRNFPDATQLQRNCNAAHGFGCIETLRQLSYKCISSREKSTCEAAGRRAGEPSPPSSTLSVLYLCVHHLLSSSYFSPQPCSNPCGNLRHFASHYDMRLIINEICYFNIIA